MTAVSAPSGVRGSGSGVADGGATGRPVPGSRLLDEVGVALGDRHGRVQKPVRQHRLQDALLVP